MPLLKYQMLNYFYKKSENENKTMKSVLFFYDQLSYYYYKQDDYAKMTDFNVKNAKGLIRHYINLFEFELKDSAITLEYITDDGIVVANSNMYVGDKVNTNEITKLLRDPTRNMHDPSGGANNILTGKRILALKLTVINNKKTIDKTKAAPMTATATAPKKSKFKFNF